jgi:hypothetical protein
MKKREDKTIALAAALDPSTPRKGLIPFDTRLIERAMSEGVAGILYKSLLASGVFESLDQVHRETLQAVYYQTIRMNLRLMHALKQVLLQANQRGVAVVILQGMGLLNDPYEDIGLRPMTDIDLWVSKKDYEEIVRILGSLGYERDSVYPSTFKQGSTIFDIHTHILWADRVKAFKMLLVNDEKYMRDGLRFIEIEGEKALCLNPYDQVIYLTLHALKHWANRLIWFVDIKKIIERWGSTEWESLFWRSKELGQERTVAYMLFLLRSTLDVELPPWRGTSHRQRLNVLEKWILRQRSKRGSLPRWAPVLLFSSQLGPGKRLLFFLENLFPRTEVLRQVFPSPPDLKPWQLYGKRTLQLLGMLKRAVRSAPPGRRPYRPEAKVPKVEQEKKTEYRRQ